jgi:hypothetical protein
VFGGFPGLFGCGRRRRCLEDQPRDWRSGRARSRCGCFLQPRFLVAALRGIYRIFPTGRSAGLFSVLRHFLFRNTCRSRAVILARRPRKGSFFPAYRGLPQPTVTCCGLPRYRTEITIKPQRFSEKSSPSPQPSPPGEGELGVVSELSHRLVSSAAVKCSKGKATAEC